MDGEDDKRGKMRIKKILLMNSPYKWHKSHRPRCVIPLGLLYLGAVLRDKGYEVKVLDAYAEGFYNKKVEGDYIIRGLSDNEIIKRITDFEPDLVGISCILSSQREIVIEYLKMCKTKLRVLNKNNLITVTGGADPTFNPRDYFERGMVDFVIKSEGEIALPKLVEAINRGLSFSDVPNLIYKSSMDCYKIIETCVKYIEDLDTLPLPAYDLVDMETYFKINKPHNQHTNSKRVVEIASSRGCPYRCVFCSTTLLWGSRIRVRSVENVLKEVRFLKDKYNIDEIQFSDDNFAIIRKRAIEIVRGIGKLGLKWCAPAGVSLHTLDDDMLRTMKETGCVKVSIGLESGNQKIIDNVIGKPLILRNVKPTVERVHKFGLKIHAFCVIGLPGETIENMYETYNFVKDCGFDSATFFSANPIPATRLERICKEKGYIIENNDSFYSNSCITTPEFTSKQVQELVNKFNKELNR